MNGAGKNRRRQCRKRDFTYHFRMYDQVKARFCSRDPIGYADGDNLYRRYFGLSKFDPRGTDIWDWLNPIQRVYPNFAGQRQGTACAVSMLDHWGEPNPGWDDEVRRVEGPKKFHVRSRQELKDFVKENNCCTLYTFGHQGDVRPFFNRGGMVSYPYPNEPNRPVFIFPSKNNRDDDTKSFLEDLFGHCDRCVLNIVGCGGTTDEYRQTRQRIANETGCTVCGSTIGLVAGGRSNNPRGPNVTIWLGGTKPHRKYPGRKVQQIRWSPECTDPIQAD